MKSMLSLILLCLALSAQARTVGIFNGAGTCPGCGETVAGFFLQRQDKVVYLNEKTLNAAALAGIQVYVQPGGSDDIDETLNALSRAQVEALRRFVADGGSYLGICAGAYLAGRYSSAQDKRPAFGLVGIDEVQEEIRDARPTLLEVEWGGQRRWVYSQSAPQLGRRAPDGARVLARYRRSGHIAGLSTRFGRGRVVLLGPHFEADADWFRQDGLPLDKGLAHDWFRQALDGL